MGSMARKLARKSDPSALKVIVYSTPTCSWCTRLKAYLSQHNIRYRDLDVSRDHTAAAEMQRRTGQMGVPVLQVGSKTIVGFDKAQVDTLLGLR